MNEIDISTKLISKIRCQIAPKRSFLILPLTIDSRTISLIGHIGENYDLLREIVQIFEIFELFELFEYLRE